MRSLTSRVGLFLVAASLLSSGCAMITYQQREALMLSVREFNEGVRWGRIEQSVVHVDPKLRDKFQQRYNDLSDDMEIVEYDVRRVDFDADKGVAKVRVDMAWNDRRTGLVERTVVEQRWEQKSGFNRWAVTKQVRVKGAHLSLFDEPPIATAAPVPAAKTEGATPAATSPDPAEAPPAVAPAAAPAPTVRTTVITPINVSASAQ